MKNNKSITISFLLWFIAIAITGLYVLYENDPYDPLKGVQYFSDGTKITFSIRRSEVIGNDLTLAVNADNSVSGTVQYRRVSSDDKWQKIKMSHQIITLRKHGRKKGTANQLAAKLPSLDKMAGKYEYIISLKKENETIFIKDKNSNPIITRYRGNIPASILIPHIVFIMLSMLIGVRASLEALRENSNYAWMLWATIATLLLGGFLFGPLVQKYAFGTLWSGIPFGWDLTDNKVVVELTLWIIALYFNTGKRKTSKWAKRAVIIAGIGTIIVYLIPHSLLGSAYDYTTGKGVGTGVQ